MIIELERQTETGIGGLCKRLFAGEFSHRDVCETIRLGLIGGGTEPQEAQALVAAYAIEAPMGQTYPLAVSILEALWFGQSKADTDNAPDFTDDPELMNELAKEQEPINEPT